MSRITSLVGAVRRFVNLIPFGCFAGVVGLCAGCNPGLPGESRTSANGCGRIPADELICDNNSLYVNLRKYTMDTFLEVF